MWELFRASWCHEGLERELLSRGRQRPSVCRAGRSAPPRRRLAQASLGCGSALCRAPAMVPKGGPPSLRGSVSCVFSVSCPSRCPSARSPHPAWSTWSIHVRQFQGWALQASESAATVGPEVVMWHQAVPLELAVFVYVLTLTCVTLYGVLLLYTCVLRVTATARLVNTSIT